MDMKKIITCAALLAGIVFFNGRLNAQVESDIVGYTTIEITNQWTLLGVPFTTLGTAEESIDLNALFANATNLVDGDQIQVPDGKNGYDLAYWNSSVGAWCNDGNDTLTSLKATRGRGVWLKASQASKTTPVTITAIGQVVLNRAADNLGTGYTIFSPALPMEGANLNDPSFTWTGLTDGDQIQVPDGTNGYDLAYWNSSVGAWCNDGNNIKTSLTFTAGGACWIMSKGSNPTVTFAYKSASDVTE